MRNYPFVIKQTGPISLTENLGTNPAFQIPVKITCTNMKLNKSVSVCVGIYYHTSDGWVPCDEENEIPVWDLLPEKEQAQYADFEIKLSMAINELGQTALLRLFRLANALYNKSHADVAISLVENDISLKPIQVTDKDVKGR